MSLVQRFFYYSTSAENVGPVLPDLFWHPAFDTLLCLGGIAAMKTDMY